MAIGLSSNKIQTLKKYPVIKLIEAAKTTLQKQQNKNTKLNSVEAYFIGTLNKIQDNNCSNYELVGHYLELLTISAKNMLDRDFNKQLNKDDRNAFNAIWGEKNPTIKQTLVNKYQHEFRKWIYNTKLQLEF